ncbi:MAG: RagB/SusD family nutrient uptake outer membrane protein [Muribaculaceae bacterium]|nr:RagB/SusD family nutrient uptake outer membrane protein [Muribaculaceae bacterium]
MRNADKSLQSYPYAIWLKRMVALMLCCMAFHFDAAAINGDVNGDNVTDIDDVNIIINIMLHKADATAAADVDGSGVVDIDDLNQIINVMLHKDVDTEEVRYEQCYRTLKESPIKNRHTSMDYAWLRSVWTLNELTTDEAICAWRDDGMEELCKDIWNAENPFTAHLFDYLCACIEVCNDYLRDFKDNESGHSAEVRWLRAWYYLGMLDAFGDIPLTEQGSPLIAPQVSRREAYDFVVRELLDIEPQLAEPKHASNGYPDRAAAWMLLARIYLNAEIYAGESQWDKAAYYAQRVVDSPYHLCTTSVEDCTPFQLLFMADNDSNGAQDEMVMTIPYDGNEYAADAAAPWNGTTFLVASTYDHEANADYLSGINQCWMGNRTRIQLPLRFLSSIYVSYGNPQATSVAAGDNRALFDTNTNRVSGGVYDINSFKQGYAYLKFRNIRSDGALPSSNEFCDIDYPLMRVAEAYLTLAEVDARQHGGQCTSQGLQSLNALRTRAAAQPLDSASLGVVLDEWSREFAFEGRRRTDLVRHGCFGGDASFNWEWKGYTHWGKDFSTLRNVFGYPAWALEANSQLKQNPGYDPNVWTVVPETVNIYTSQDGYDPTRNGLYFTIRWDAQTIERNVMAPIYVVEMSVNGETYVPIDTTYESEMTIHYSKLYGLVNELAKWDSPEAMPEVVPLYFRISLLGLNHVSGEGTVRVKSIYQKWHPIALRLIENRSPSIIERDMVPVFQYDENELDVYWRLVYVDDNGVRLHLATLLDDYVIDAADVTLGGELADGISVDSRGFYSVVPRWYLMVASVDRKQGEVVCSVQFNQPQVWLMGPVTQQGDWNELEEGSQFSVPTTADGEFVSPPFARSVPGGDGDGVRAYVKIPGYDWWKSEFMVYNDTIAYRGKAWDQNSPVSEGGFGYRVPGKAGQRLYFNFSNDTGRIE